MKPLCRTRVIVSVACALTVLTTLQGAGQGTPAATPNKKILLIGDRPSHAPSEHEHNAAVWLLQKALTKIPGITATPSFGAWPADAQLIDQADAIFMVCDGGERHMAFQENRAEALQRAVARGAGVMFLHYCVEPGAEKGRQQMLAWTGGYFEINYSVNPVWEADFKTLPNHPIARGVQPFSIRDEWYYNMRFRPNMQGVTPILTAVPTPDTLSRPDGPHEGNPDVRSKAGQPMVVMWATENANGSRGVGMTGGHYHNNFGNENFRKLVINSVLWIAHIDVPAAGVNYALGPDELNERLDPKPPRRR
jgi:type 1 glutamine amidotransferase